MRDDQSVQARTFTSSMNVFKHLLCAQNVERHSLAGQVKHTCGSPTCGSQTGEAMTPFNS